VTPERPRQPPRQELFGIPIDALTMSEAIARVEAAVRSRSRLRIGVVNAAKIVNMRRDPALRQDVVSSDMILADGASVVWASRVLGRPLPERVAGIDIMTRVLEDGDRRGYRVYCLGATEAVLAAVVARIAIDYPGVVVAGAQDGYFSGQQEQSVADAIRASRADVLFVAMTSPKKENFLGQWGDYVEVPVCHGVGGSFDVLAGKVRRAPALWQRLGLEWLYRVLQEPGRLWKRYLVTNTLFCLMVLAERFGRRTVPVVPPGREEADARLERRP
jgi:N-acetylglucosaminyldiphosphoundecaprenol N-acetyl-beta-D-mannosaminyltransferase